MVAGGGRTRVYTLGIIFYCVSMCMMHVLRMALVRVEGNVQC